MNPQKFILKLKCAIKEENLIYISINITFISGKGHSS